MTPIGALNRWKARHPWGHNDHFDAVTGVDPDAAMVEVSRARLADRAAVVIGQQSLLDTAGSFDLVTMLASLHHLSLEPALRHAAGLVAPGGRLLVVGLARTGSPPDLVYGGATLLLDPVVGFVKHPWARTSPDPGRSVPIRDPEETYDEVRATARRVLSGAQLHRRLFYRYTRRWEG